MSTHDCDRGAQGWCGGGKHGAQGWCGGGRNGWGSCFDASAKRGRNGCGEAEARAPFREEILRRQAAMLREELARIEERIAREAIRESRDGT